LKSAFKEYIQFSWQNLAEKVSAKKVDLSLITYIWAMTKEKGGKNGWNL